MKYFLAYQDIISLNFKGSSCCSETQTISFHYMKPEWQLKLKDLVHLNFTDLYNEFIKN